MAWQRRSTRNQEGEEAEHRKSRRRGGDGGWDKGRKSMVGETPLLSTAAGPQDGDAWRQRFPPPVRRPRRLPQVAPEIELPMLDVKTHKMCRGGKICITVYFRFGRRRRQRGSDQVDRGRVVRD